MLNEYLNTLKEVLFNPKDFYKDMPKKGGYSNPFKFAFISFFINTLGSLALLYIKKIPTNQELIVIPFVLIIAPLIMGLFVYVGAFIFHIFFKLMKGKANYECTFRIFAFASSVSVISWIPWVGTFVSLYALYLYVLGGKQVHKLSTTRSILAILLPLIILMIIAVIIAYYLIINNFLIGGFDVSSTFKTFGEMQNITF